MTQEYEHYYVPSQSAWPIVTATGLGCFAIGLANIIHGKAYGSFFFVLSMITIIGVLYAWFKDVIDEGDQGLYSAQMDRTFRWGMFWFIFSEVMFFAAFFGALFYCRELSVPWLGGDGAKDMTHSLLWPEFKAGWPLLTTPDPTAYAPIKHAMSAWGLPAINTLILLTSGATLTWAHWGLKENRRRQLNQGLFLTVILGALFLTCQVYEYIHAYHELNLKLSSGVYGSTFFMLTGFHGFHVTIGTIMLATILYRTLHGHFTPARHFGFEAVAWYWHFVDVVWLLLFILVYWL